MGVDASALIVLAGLSRSGMLKGDVLTLGRHNTFFKSRNLRKLNKIFNLKFSRKLCDQIQQERFTEDLFFKLGATSCMSVDGSDYEGASYVHDLNTPFEHAYFDKFDFIYDGGTSEHIYDVAQVQKNVCLALKDGGIFFASCPSNGQPGHGFYQFSPEFYFRSLQKIGFQIVRAYLVASQFPVQWYSVRDPKDVGGRIEYLSAEPIYIFVIARKNHAVASGLAPLQSDYELGNWRTQKDHLVWDRTLRAKLLRLGHRILISRWLWAINILTRKMFFVGAAVWSTSEGIRRINIVEDLRQLQKENETLLERSKSATEDLATGD